ncbi:MAG: branched-chain amino acid ABC transporter ATP-binding protein/permease [Rhizobiaceae bacterium]|nr:branched-chain amino acid ABC transporter ATP-binding protein/permease [Rhizobiaceae bacterium]
MKRDRSMKSKLTAALAAVALTIAVVSVSFAGPYMIHVAILTVFAIVLGLSHRLLMLAGQASFAHAAFYGIGAYVFALSTTSAGLFSWLALIAAAVACVAMAAIVGPPALRTRGPYFLVVSFGFVVVVGSVLHSWKSVTNGSSGIIGIPKLAGIPDLGTYYWASIVLLAIALVAFLALDRARWGLQLRALGQTPKLAEATGINPGFNMVLAFVVGAGVAGLMGGFYASYIGFVAPSAFTLWVSVFILSYSVIGGANHFLGPVIGAMYITLTPVLFNWSERFTPLLITASFAIIVFVAPKGILSVVKRIPRRFKETPAPELAGPSTDNGVTPLDFTGKRAPARLEVRGLCHNFGGVKTAQNIAFQAEPGEVLGVIGPNGAGKTTLFNLLSGFLKPKGGQILIDGERLDNLSPAAIVNKGLIRTFQSTVVFEDMTVFENILIGVWASRPASLYETMVTPRSWASEDVAKANEIIERFDLGAVAKLSAGSLPYGTKKLVGLAVGVAGDPRVLCLDEPMAGMTGAEVEHMVKILQRMKATRSITILIVEHRMPAVMGLCDRIVTLNFGQIIATGTPAEIQSNSLVREIYLG